MAQIFNRDEKVVRKHINNVFNDGELDRKNNTQKMRVDRTVITKHIKNIYEELEEKSTSANFAIVQKEGIR